MRLLISANGSDVGRLLILAVPPFRSSLLTLVCFQKPEIPPPLGSRPRPTWPSRFSGEKAGQSPIPGPVLALKPQDDSGQSSTDVRRARHTRRIRFGTVFAPNSDKVHARSTTVPRHPFNGNPIHSNRQRLTTVPVIVQTLRHVVAISHPM